MASRCPKCHQIIEDDAICCADVRHTWKCRRCGKLNTGFVVPYGRCYLCGGEHEVIESYETKDPAKTRIIEEAFQFELNMRTFYELAQERTTNARVKAVLEEMRAKEQDHIGELEAKYHVHLDADQIELDPKAKEALAKSIFAGIDLTGDGEQMVKLYNKAIAMERRTRDHFLARAKAFPPGKEREFYRELAAEEDDHIATLETERDQFVED